MARYIPLPKSFGRLSYLSPLRQSSSASYENLRSDWGTQRSVWKGPRKTIANSAQTKSWMLLFPTFWSPIIFLPALSWTSFLVVISHRTCIQTLHTILFKHTPCRPRQTSRSGGSSFHFSTELHDAADRPRVTQILAKTNLCKKNERYFST